MFKCCVCHKKASRRTSQEEDDSERELDKDDDSTSSEREDAEDKEEKVIEEELTKTFKSQISIPRDVNTVGEPIKEIPSIENEDNKKSTIEKMVVKVIDADIIASKEGIEEKVVDREALKEDVVEILNCAVKIVQEIRREERERLEEIKEEAVEESIEPSIIAAVNDVTINEKIKEYKNEDEVVVEAEKPNAIKITKNENSLKRNSEKIKDEYNENKICEINNEIKILKKSKTDQIEEMIIEELINEMNEEIDNDQELKEIQATNDGQQLLIEENNRMGEETVRELDRNESISSLADELLPPPYCEVQIIEEIKKVNLFKIDEHIKDCSSATNEIQANHDNCLIDKTAEGSIVNYVTNGDFPASVPAMEENDELEKSEENTAELSFPTPPPIDFDIEEPDWNKDSTPPLGFHEVANLTSFLNRGKSEPTSPDSKSLPSPPSPGSLANESGDETEVDSKSNSDEQTAKIMPFGSNTTYVEHTIADIQDEDGDDSIFEVSALVKDPEILKDIPPRPVPPVPRWLSQEEDEPENNEDIGGMQEPPATPVARDELALRRHRFFSDLLQAARSTAEHRVSFDPLGPLVHPGCEHDEREEHLEELVNRLENVTKRLEIVSTSALIVQTQEIAVQTKSPSPERSLSLTEELHPEESSQSSSSSHESTISGASVVEVLKNMSLAAYQDLLAGPVQDYIQLSRKIGGDVANHCQLVEKAFQIQLQFLNTVASRPAPANQSEQVTLLAPTSTQIQEIQDFREKHRGSEFFNHLSAINESISALGWVAVSPTPAPYVKEMNDAGQFYINRVLKDWKEKDKTHVEWCKAWVKTLTDLQQFVRQHHTTGLVWAKSGSAPFGGVPPPPPPCTMPVPTVSPVINDDRSALFAEINQGENITKNLKKVTSDMQTHKNTSLRTGPAPFKAPVVSNNSSPVKTTLPANAPIDKPSVFTRDGKKWLIEYHKGNKNIVVENVEMNNVVYIFRCQDSSIVIKGKINSVVMDSCRKSAVVVDSVVASIEFVNCQSVQMQVIGKVPTISIDKTDGCQMYLNKDTLDVELITSKSSEMNVMVPLGNGDYMEYPVPEQFKTVITNKGLNTIAVDSLG